MTSLETPRMMTMINSESPVISVPGYHPITRWLHAGLVLGVLFQLGCTVWMAYPEHQRGGHGDVGIEQSAYGAHNAHPSAMRPASVITHEKGNWRQWLMQAHRTGGVLVALIVLANLFWALTLRGESSHRQVGVLFSSAHWRKAGAILIRLPSMLIGRQPLVAPGNALSLIVEMLGLLVMGTMALTGFIIWNMWLGPSSMVSHDAETLMNIHSFFASLLMFYLVGHVSMALIHARSGDRVFARISPLGK